jgi:hypothetical protein
MGGKRRDMGRDRVDGAVYWRGVVVIDFANQLGMGEVEGVVAAVDTEDDVLPKDSQERREEAGEDSHEEEVEAAGDMGEETEQATQGELSTDLSLPLLCRAGFSAALPLRCFRSSSPHSTTFSKQSRSSVSRRFELFDLEWLGLVLRRSMGKRGPCILARTSAKGMQRDSS